MDCPRLVEVSGLDGLPSLRELEIQGCINLRILNGLSGLVSLETFRVGESCPNLQVFLCELENLARLQRIECQSHYFGSLLFNMTNLVNLEYLKIGDADGWLIDSEGGLIHPGQNSLGNNSDQEVDFIDFAMLGAGGVTRPSHLSNLQSISHLALKGLRSLASLNGIEFLLPLEHLSLRNLQNLTCLKAIEFLINLQIFKLKECESVEELPSLCALVNVNTLYIRHCVKLKAVEGCDAMTKLSTACFMGCKSLEILPLGYGTLTRMQTRLDLSISGTKFAHIDALIEWALDTEAPVILRKASLSSLDIECYFNLSEMPMERSPKVITRVVQQLVQENKCLELLEWANVLEERWRSFERSKVDYPDTLVELLRAMATMPKEGAQEKCRSDTGFKLDVAKCLAQTDRVLVYNFFSLLKDVLMGTTDSEDGSDV